MTLTADRFNQLGAQSLPGHLGRTTQVWDAVVTHRETGKTIALFRCTQMVLHGKAAG